MVAALACYEIATDEMDRDGWGVTEAERDHA